MREASVMLIINNGLILGVSRRDDKTKFGLPGGKVEDNESHAQAAIRETFEETGVRVVFCVEVFRREEVTPDGEMFYTYCYYASSWEGEPKDSEEGIVEWLTTEELIGDRGAFPDYNKKMLETFKLKYPNITFE